jgi:hypothetical protein
LNAHSRPQRARSTEFSLEAARLARTAPRPTQVQQTGLSLPFLSDLAAKHLVSHGVMPLSELVGRLGLAGPVVDQILQFMRGEGLVEVRSRLGSEGELRYGLTERGRTEGYEGLLRNGYVGPAPVPLDAYCDVVAVQSIRSRRIERDMLARALANLVLSRDLCDRLGPALNSGRAVFLYGAAGTGKTSVAQQLARVLPDPVLVPHAVAVGATVLQVFDPQLHVQVADASPVNPLQLGSGWDARFACCERPVVTAAGELTLEMLEVQRDPVARTCVAPLQMKANNGVFLIDDLGRQRVSPRALFDRWIVPMEEARDYLTAGNGQHFAVPFDAQLVFSTNLDPRDLADDAFLRRIGYKIELKPCTTDQFATIWRSVCEARDVDFDPQLLGFVLGQLYPRQRTALLPCHPRDLIGMALDWKTYRGEPTALDEEALRWAWSNYFLDGASLAAAPNRNC